MCRREEDFCRAVSQTGNANCLAIQVVCCNLLAAVFLSERKKPEANQYASMGLEALASLRLAMPQHASLALQDSLESLQKKARRRFF